jgi:hypothetical protein
VQRPVLEPGQVLAHPGHLAHHCDRGRGETGGGLGDPGERRGDRALVGPRAVRDDGGRRVGRHPVGDQPAGVLLEGADAHEEDERAGRRRERAPVDRALGLRGILVARDERDLGGHPALRHRDAGIGGDSVGRAHAGDDLEGDPGSLERQRLLAPAPEDERIAPFQPHHRRQPRAELDQYLVQALLGHRVLARALPPVDPLGVVGRKRDDARIGEAVVDDRVAPLHELAAANGQEPGIARAGADEINGHAAVQCRSLSSPSSCQA